MSRKLKWKPLPGTDMNGKPCVHDPSFLDTEPNLFERIQSMPKGKALTLAQANDFFWHVVAELCFDANDPRAAAEFSCCDWIQWLTAEGYSIELDGSEYEWINDLDS